MKLSNKTVKFFIGCTEESYNKILKEVETLREYRAYLSERVGNLETELLNTNSQLNSYKEILSEVSIEINHNISDEDKIENIREIIGRYINEN